MLDENKDQMPAKKGWIRVVLAVSLALNLATVGFVAGSYFRFGGHGAGFARSPGLGAFGAPYMKALPPEHRRTVVAAIRSTSGDQMPSRKMRREMFEDVLATLRAEPFDADLLRQAVTRQANTSVLVQQQAQQAWLDVVNQMEDAERIEYATAIEQMLKRRPRKGGTKD